MNLYNVLALLSLLLGLPNVRAGNNETLPQESSSSSPKDPLFDVSKAVSPRSVITNVMDLVLSFYRENNETSLNLRSPLSRAVKASTSTITSLSYGNLAILGAVLLGGLALAGPSMFTDYRRRVGPLPQVPHPGYPLRFMDGLTDLSAEMIPYLENEIQRGHYYYKRNKRSASGDERVGLHDFISNRFMAVSESVMVWVERTLDNLPNLPRLEAQACMKRCICEAHNQPKKYGLTGLVLQLFFPPYIENDTPSKIISKYQLAARYGRTENANCAIQYDDCIVNFLDLVQSLTNLIV